MAEPTANELDPNERVVIVSWTRTSAHACAKTCAAYCPKAYLEDFDDFTSFVEEKGGTRGLEALNATEGHFDPHARLRDLDYDGIAAEVIFHGSQNGEPIPFQSFGPFLGYENGDNLELLGVGYHIYNRVARRLLLGGTRASRGSCASPDVGRRRRGTRGGVGARSRSARR